MNNLFKLIAAIFLLAVPSVLANDLVVPLTANTVSNVFSTPKLISNITILATTTNNTTVKFYDSATTSTNYVQAAYTAYTSYATNYSVVFTNSAGLLVTNTFSGRYTAPVVNNASTNERPYVLRVVVPASAQYSRDVQIHPLRGLTALSDNAAILTVTYENPQ